MMKLKNRICLIVFGFFITVGAAQAQSSLWTNLVSYWPFDTATATATPDLVIGNDLLLSNAPVLVAGERGSAFQFNGANQFLGLVHSTSPADTGLPIYYSTNGYTIAFWVNGPPTQANNRTVFSEGNLANSGLLLNFATQGGSLRLYLRNDSGSAVINNYISSATVFDNTWHFVAWADDQGAATLYIDGNVELQTNYTYSLAGGAHADDDSVGALYRSKPVNFLTGSVDELTLWSRVLSQTEIQTVMTGGIPTPIPPVPPSVTGQPADSTNAMGDRATFAAHVYGTRPISYQWLSNGAPLPGQTNNTLALTDLTSPGTNFYALAATNLAGAVTSNPAMLVVLPDPPPNVPDGLVSYWPFDTVAESPTTNSPDLYSAEDMVLNLMDSNNLAPGVFSNALTFDGVTQYGSVSGATPIYDLDTNYTVAFWVKGAAGQTNRQVFANGNSTNGNYFFIGTDNTGAGGKVDVRVEPGLTDTLSTGTAFDGSWHHIVWVDQDGTGLLYIDGVLDPTVFNYARGTVLLNNTTVGALLANPLRDYFAGAVDDLGVWSRRLSYTEIQTILTNGIPAPSGPVKPTVFSLTTQPANLTTNVYQGDTVSFSVQAGGTPPLSYQWQAGNTPISAASNPTALTNTLVLTNVQPTNSGGYSVIISNAGGTATSSVVQLTVTPYTPVSNGTALQLEFNNSSSGPVQPGFSSMTLSANPATFNGPEVTLAAIGSTSLSSRARTLPTNNPPNLTQADLYDQFIFSTAKTPGTGIDVRINRLAPNTAYQLTVWSYDELNQSLSDWSEVASGTPVTIQNGYYFSGVLPSADYQDTITGMVISSSTGQMEIRGLVDPANPGNAGVFLNALVLVATNSPTPQLARQPQSATVTEGEAYTNLVVAWGAAPLAYQWYQDGVALPTQTNASLIFNPVQSTNSGDYYVVVTNANGSITSDTVKLTVYSTPVILQSYTNMVLFAGARPTFSVTAAGVAPLSYQWTSNGVAIPGGTNASYTQPDLQPGATNYACLIANALGSVTDLVSVTVIAAPTSPYPQAVLAGNPVGYWRLNETNDPNVFGNGGVIANDYWGGHDGIYTNTTLGNPGYNPSTDPTDTSAGFGLAGLSFTDNDVYNIGGIDFATPANASAAFSVEAWVNGYQQTVDAGIVAKGYGNGGEQFDLDTGSDTLANHGYRFFVRGASGTFYGVSSSVAPTNGIWQHLVGVCDEPHGVVTLYVNGAAAGTASIPSGAGILASTNLMTIGSRASSAFVNNDDQFVGYVDDVAVYDYALSASQVAQQYAAASGVVTTPTISIGSAGGNVVITYTGTLRSATNVAGPYNPVSGAASPYTNAPSGDQVLFFRTSSP